ncbi:MAG: FlgD immunoglobulin-like domain containing protein [Candidatus Krumholzibacteriia bacterium]
MLPWLQETPFVDTEPRCPPPRPRYPGALPGRPLDLVDISDRDQPVRVSRIGISYPYCNTLATHGSLVYCASDYGLTILDASVPSAPVWVGQIYTDMVKQIAIEGDLLAVARTGDTRLYSLANPVAPVLRSTLPAAPRVSFLDGQRLALLFNGFAVIDVSDAAQPVETSRIEMEGFADYEYSESTIVHNLVAYGDRLLGHVEFRVASGSIPHGTYRVSRYYDRVVYDPSAPGEPVEIARVQAGYSEDSLHAPVFPVLRRGDLLLDGRDVLDLAGDSLWPVSRLPFLDPLDADLLAGPGDEVLLVSDTGLTCLQTADLQAPNAVNVVRTGDDVTTCGWGGANEHLWAELWGGGIGGLRYGFEPGDVGQTLPVDGSGSGCRLFADLVLVPTESGQRLFRITPDGVTEYGVPFGSVSEIFELAEGLVAVRHGAWLSVLELGDPAAPVEMGSVDLAGVGSCGDLRGRVMGDRLLICGDDVVALVSVADPEAPAVVSTLPIGGLEWAEPWTDTLVTAKAGDQLHRLDFTDPASPTVAFSVPAGRVDFPPVVVGDVAYASGGKVPFTRTGTLVVLLDLATLDQIGVAVADLPQHSLHVTTDGALFTAGTLNGWNAIPAACEASVTSVETALPSRAAGLGVFPNPFNPQTSVVLEMARAGRAELTVYDARGRQVRRFALGVLPAGPHRVTWNGRDAAERELPSGVYLVQLTSPAGSAAAKAVLVR